VFSGHKLYAPSGIGVMYGKQALLEAMPPYQGGGDMIPTGICGIACAPSNKTGIFFALAAAIIFSTGLTVPSAFDICTTETNEHASF
jgi:selenocysteine lyase/cysteine desulfurase